MNESYTIKEANTLFREKKYSEALKAYEEIISKHPEKASLYSANIKITRRKLNIKAIPTPQVIQPTNFIPQYLCNVTSSSAYAWMNKKINENLDIIPSEKATNLVSIVMPIRNCAEIIEHSIASIQNQSHKNIEIIVVDDFSTDNTQDIVLNLAQKDNRIKYKKLNSNLGTYFARSYGVHLSEGDFVTFQDADDFSHSFRIEHHLKIALKNNLTITTSNYARFDLNSGKIVNFHGRDHHYGFITTFVKRSLFNEIGSFDLTTRGGDAEFSERIARYVDKNEIYHISVPYYLASDMPGSLSHGEIDRNTNDKMMSLSFPRAKYTKKFQAIQQTFSKLESAQVFRFPMLRSPYNLPYPLNNSNVGDYIFIGCICTIPERKDIFEKSFRSIEAQVDIIYVYPDKYKEEEIPDYLIKSPKVKILSTEDHPGLRDGAKFLPLQLGLMDVAIDKTIIFTFDDDIYYPPDYTHSLFNRLKSIDFSGVVGVHGAILQENFENFRSDRTVFNFKHFLERQTCVDVLGTGTTAFRADLLRSRFQSQDINPGFIDISLAIVCRKNHIPMYCVSRPHAWLQDLTEGVDTPSLWNELVNNSTPHTQALKKLGARMWGQNAIKLLFVESTIYLPKNKTKETRSLNIDMTDKRLHFWRLRLESDSIYRVSIMFTETANLEGLVTLENTNSGKEIYSKQLTSSHISFLCNGALNKNIGLNLSKIKPKEEHIDIEISVEKLFESKLPRISRQDDRAVTACLATYPPRENCLEDVITATLPQVDKLCVYLNRYSSPPRSVVEVLESKEKESSIDFILDYSGKPKASGKFRWLDYSGYVFTLDDDIVYPGDYFKHLIGWIEKYKRKAFIGVHGIIFKEQVSSFHSSSESSIAQKFNFSAPLPDVKKVHMIGTGTLAFHSSLIYPYRKELYELMNFRSGYENANDECLAVFCNKKNIPMYIAPRQEGWLRSNKKMKYGIYEEHFNDESLSKSVIELLSSANPWPNLP